MVVGGRVVRGILKIGNIGKLGDVTARRHRTNDAMTKRRLLLDSEHQVYLFGAPFESS